MYQRLLNPSKDKSLFLFGPRGTGKTTYLRNNFPDSIYIDLLEAENFNELSANPQRLAKFIPKDFDKFIIIDEIQKIPELLNEVHRLIENNRFKFILTGSSARKLRQKGVNLLAGRALTYSMYPLTVSELKRDFDISNSLQYGHLPSVFGHDNIKKYLESYVMTYLKQEVIQEGLTRNLLGFSRFLEVASFSQGQILNISEVARECSMHRKVVENYFHILEDLMVAYRIPVFTKKSKRKLINHAKFYFFDVGIYNTIKPKGPLDINEESQGIGLETLVLQEIKAINDYLNLGYDIHYWRTTTGIEVDFILYGEKGLLAIEVKRSEKINDKHLKNLKIFLKEYESAKGILLYGGSKILYEDNITIIPVEIFLQNTEKYLN